MRSPSAEPLAGSPAAGGGLARKGMFKRHRMLAGLLVLTTSLVLVLVAAELVFRWFVPVTDVAFQFWDPLLGPRRSPHQSGRSLMGGYVDGSYRFNAQGWNHAEDYDFAKPPETLRVCVVGDSYVEVLHVNVTDALFAVGERRMNRPDRPAQWYAFGCSGWGPSHAYEAVRHYVLDYHPDVVLLLFVLNDPFDSSPYLLARASFEPVFWLDGDGELRRRPVSQWKPVWWRRLAARSALVRYFVLQKHLLQRLDLRPRRRGPGGFALREQVAGARNDYVEGLEAMSVAQRHAKTWELIGKLMQAMRDECARRGALFAVVFRGWIPDIEAPIGGSANWPDTPTPPKEQDPYCLESRVGRMGPEQLAPICERLGIPYLDLTDALRAEVAATGRSHCFPDNDHWSALGHRAAGEALAGWLESLMSSGQSGK